MQYMIDFITNHCISMQVAMFAHPEGLACKKVAPLPTYYTIVFTSNEGRRVYAVSMYVCMCVCVYIYIYIYVNM
jgi:hypothetical protein